MFEDFQISHLYEPFEVERADLDNVSPFIVEWCVNGELGVIYGIYFGGSYLPARKSAGWGGRGKPYFFSSENS